MKSTKSMIFQNAKSLTCRNQARMDSDSHHKCNLGSKITLLRTVKNSQMQKQPELLLNV